MTSSWVQKIPDGKVHGANMGPTWVLSAPCGPHVGFMNLAIWDISHLTQLLVEVIGYEKKRYFQILTNITIHIAKPMDHFDISGPLALQYV